GGLNLNNNSAWGDDGPPVGDKIQKIIAENHKILNEDLQGAFVQKPILKNVKHQDFQARYPQIIADNHLKLFTQIHELVLNKKTGWGENSPPAKDIIQKIIENNRKNLNKNFQGVLVNPTRIQELIANNKLELNQEFRNLFVK